MRPPTVRPRDSKTLTNTVLFSTFGVIAVVTTLLLYDLYIKHSRGATVSLLVCGAAIVYVTVLYVLWRLDYHRTVSYLLVVFYAVLAAGIIWGWGVNTPVGLLILGLFIVLAGILLTAKHSLVAAIVSWFILTAVYLMSGWGWHTPDTSWMVGKQSYGDVAAYSVIFSMLAIVSWLYNREMERSLAYAHQAESALLHQKATLKQEVKKRTAELRTAQLQELQNMYRFTQLGQHGVTLLHDLANHVTALTLELEGMEHNMNTPAFLRTQTIINYLTDVINNAKDRLNGKPQEQMFNVARKIREIVSFLSYKAEDAGVTIDWKPPRQTIEFMGDPAYFRQIVGTIADNAIDAYESSDKQPHPKQRRVNITLNQTPTHILIHVIDWGKGLTRQQQNQLFKPFQSTKKNGLGLGLFIAKQMAETYFKGSLSLNTLSDNTDFIIKLPRTHAK
jgi:signal transduction histidine kinase